MREVREESKMSSAWLFFKCLVGAGSSVSKVENRDLKDTVNQEERKLRANFRLRCIRRE